MPPTYLLARDHLERAASILSREADDKTRQLRLVIERTLDLLAEFERCDRRSRTGNVVDFETFRCARGRQGPEGR